MAINAAVQRCERMRVVSEILYSVIMPYPIRPPISRSTPSPRLKWSKIERKKWGTDLRWWCLGQLKTGRCLTLSPTRAPPTCEHALSSFVVVVVPKEALAPYPVVSYCVCGSDDGFGARTRSSGNFARLCCRSASRRRWITDAMPEATAAAIIGVEGAKRWTERAAFIASKSLPGCFQLCRCVRSFKHTWFHPYYPCHRSNYAHWCKHYSQKIAFIWDRRDHLLQSRRRYMWASSALGRAID